MKRVVIAGSQRLEYTLIQSVRRDVLLQALPEAGIRVYAPKAMRLRDVDALVRGKAEELRKMQRDVEAKLAADRRAHPKPLQRRRRQICRRLQFRHRRRMRT